MQKEAPKTTYERSVNFYQDKIAELQKESSLLSEGNLWGSINITEQIELAQLKLSQAHRRHEVGLLK